VVPVAEYFPESQLAQDVAPDAAANDPAAQAVQAEDAATLDFPATQSVHMLDPSADANFPVTQLVHDDALEPENVPKEQLTQDVYNPLYSREYLPEEQAVQDVAAALEKEPAAQAVHPVESFPPRTLSYLPASQEVHDAAELALY
jgi:hypothetical protein